MEATIVANNSNQWNLSQLIIPHTLRNFSNSCCKQLIINQRKIHCILFKLVTSCKPNDFHFACKTILSTKYPFPIWKRIQFKTYNLLHFQLFLCRKSFWSTCNAHLFDEYLQILFGQASWFDHFFGAFFKSNFGWWLNIISNTSKVGRRPGK